MNKIRRVVATLILGTLFAFGVHQALPAAPSPKPKPQVPVEVIQKDPVEIKLPFSMAIGWLVTVAAGLGAVGVIWRSTAVVGRAAARIHAVTKVLVSIANEFQPNSGSSLKDVVTRLETAVTLAATERAQIFKKLSDLQPAAEAAFAIMRGPAARKRVADADIAAKKLVADADAAAKKLMDAAETVESAKAAVKAVDESRK